MPRWPLILLLFGLTLRAEPVPSAKVLERYKQMLATNPAEGLALDRLWQAYSELGQTAQLLAHYSKPSSFADQMVLGLLLRKAGRDDEAAAAFLKAAELDGKSPIPFLALARLRSDRGQHAAAAPAFEKALELLPQTDGRYAETVLQLGNAWLSAGDVGKAAEAWERTIALEPSNLELRRRLAENYLANRLAGRALWHLEFLKTHSPPAGRAQALQQLARVHQGAGRQDESIRALNEALANVGPGNWLRGELQSQLIRLHQRYHRSEELEELWKKNAADNPRDIGAYLQLIDFYERLGNLEQQLDWLVKLTALAPKNAEFRHRLARAHLQMDQVAPAAALYDQLLIEQPSNVDIVFEQARIDLQRDAIPSARERLIRLLQKHPGDDGIRRRTIEFFRSHRFLDLAEQQLRIEAGSGTEAARVALADFLFTQKRDTEAIGTIEGLVEKKDPPAQQAAAQLRVAQILKEQNQLEPAVAAARAVIALQGESRELQLLLGELLTGLERRSEACEAFEKAYALSVGPADLMEADQQLFDAIRGNPPPAVPETAPPFIKKPRPSDPQLADYILELTRAAAEKPSVDRWLRVARWHFWNRSLLVAQECAKQALELDPGSIETHEFLVKLAASERQIPLALKHLDELIRLNPAGRDGFLRRTAQIKMEANQAEEALRIFAALVKSNPGNLEALSDLGVAQQRAERWKEALVTWQQIDALTPVPRKKESAGALLRIFERLGQTQDAAALLLGRIDAAPDEKTRLVTFQDLLAHCTKHGLLDWLRGEFQKRREILLDDYFTDVALGRILKAQGDKAGAFDLLSDASFAAANQAEALPELIREAEELRKLPAAIRLQAQLVRVVPQSNPNGWIKLARLEEKNFQVEEAGVTWEKIVARFPRELDVLQFAAEFQLKWSSSARAREWLRRLREIDSSNLHALRMLAEIHIESGAIKEAESCLEDILRHSTPDNRDGAIRFPGHKQAQPARLQNAYLSTVRLRGGQPDPEAIRALRGFWNEVPATSKSNHDLRFNAIRDLARLVGRNADPKAMGRWIARWREVAGETPSEALWALYYAGATGPFLDEVQTLMARPEFAALSKQAFIWFALEASELDRLAKWLHDPARTSVDRDFFFVTVNEYFEAGRIDPEFAPKIFSGNFRLRMWQTATSLASRGRYRQATVLGKRVFDSLSTQRPGFGLQLARWHLFAGDLDAARRVLADSMPGFGDSFDDPIYAVIREHYFILPEDERGPFATALLQGLDAQRTPIHAAICGILLHGLAGNEETAFEQLRYLIELRPLSNLEEGEGSPGTRYWTFILEAGVQLQQWRMDWLAIYLWENALADRALMALQKDPNSEAVYARTTGIRTRLAAVKILRASPPEAERLTAEFARYVGVEGLVSLAERLKLSGASARAIAIFRRLWEHEPSNPHALRNLVSACRSAKDLGTLEIVLKRCVKEGFYRTNEMAHRDLVIHLADLFVERGALGEARAVLEKAIVDAPHDTRVLMRIGKLDETAQRPDAAVTAYQRLLVLEPGNGGARMALAALLPTPAAIAVLEKAGTADAEARLVLLYFENNQFDDAMAALERLPVPNQYATAPLIADRLIARGESRVAPIILRNIISRGTDERATFPLQAKLIELLAPESDRALISREWRRLRRMAGTDPELLENYFHLQLQQRVRLDWRKELHRELMEEWKDGDGSVVAGAALMEEQIATASADELEALFARLMAREDMGESLLRKLLAVFSAGKRTELILKTHARLARLNPLNFKPTLEWAEALRKVGKISEAIGVLEQLSLLAMLNDEMAGEVAQALAELGAVPGARQLFARAIAADPAARHFKVHLNYVRLLVKEREFPKAIKLLRVAFQNPANQEYGEIIATLRAADRLEQFEAMMAEFWFDPARLAAVREAAAEGAGRLKIEN